MKILKNKILLLIIISTEIYTILITSSIATTGKVTTESARIREEASSNSSVISVATKGEKVDVIDEEDGWYKVKFEDVTGYIRSDLVDTEFSGTSSSNNSITDDSDNTTNSETNTSLSDDFTVSTYDNSSDNTDSVVDNNLDNTDVVDDNRNNQGGENVQTNLTASSVFTIEKEANVRRMPSFSSRSISSIANGTELTILDKLNHWIKVTDGNVTGWMVVESVMNSSVQETTSDNAETLASTVEVEKNDELTNTDNFSEDEDENNTTTNLSSTSSGQKIGYINVDSARIREKPNGNVIDVVDLNDKVEILDEEDGWYKINIKGYKGCYISKSLVTVNK